MLRLTSPNLPTSVVANPQKAPLCRIYNGVNRNLAPIARINIYAKYGVSQGFNTIQFELTPPLFVGDYYQINLGYKIQTIKSGTSINLISRPSYLTPDNFWFKDSLFNVIVNAARAGKSLTLNICALTSVPIPDSNFRYILDLSQWGTFQATSVLVQGLTFKLTQNPTAPQLYEFTQIAGKLSLFGAAQSALKVGAQITLCGTQLVTLAQPTTKVCLFDLSSSGIDSLDKLDYLGISFSQAKDFSAPTIGSFIWDEQSKQVAIFLSQDQARGLPSTVDTQVNTGKSISQLTF